MNVNMVAKLLGISVRTLHYYDEIGLLKPDSTTEAGHRLYSDKNVNITYGDIGENGISVLSYSKKEYMKELFLKLAVVLILLYAFMIFLHIVFVRRLIAWIIRRLTVLCKDIDAYSEELDEKRV